MVQGALYAVANVGGVLAEDTPAVAFGAALGGAFVGGLVAIIGAALQARREERRALRTRIGVELAPAFYRTLMAVVQAKTDDTLNKACVDVYLTSVPIEIALWDAKWRADEASIQAFSDAAFGVSAETPKEGETEFSKASRKAKEAGALLFDAMEEAGIKLRQKSAAQRALEALRIS